MFLKLKIEMSFKKIVRFESSSENRTVKQFFSCEVVTNLEGFGLANVLTREVVPFLGCQVHLEGCTYRNKDRLHHRKF